ncbi:MAG: Nif3-like dinuclear metal center hexameric protein [Planctomycetaceae bacterium]|nr:Nif3-like dinuclear metal center hexameric protein [Planctomycetaceae bacterium]
MSTVSEVITILESIAPPELAEDWDNTGLLVGDRNADVSSILTCLTLTPDVAKEAVASGVDLIVSHHPVMFRGRKVITDSDTEGRMLLLLIENRIAVYSPHTSFDSAAGGVNQQLAEAFGVDSPVPLRFTDTREEDGAGRWGCLPSPVKMSDFLSTVRKAVGTSYVEYCGDAEGSVQRVAVACGAAAEFLRDAMQQQCDVFVTGEARFHSVLEARAAGIGLILTGHYSSERPAVERLAQMIFESTGLAARPSQLEHDPLRLFKAEQ